MPIMSSMIISVAALISSTMCSMTDGEKTIQDFKNEMYSSTNDSWYNDFFNNLPVTDNEFSLTFLE